MIGEIDSARDGANDGSEDVPNQRIHDRPEGCADDHADGEIDRVPAQSKFLEFLDHHRLLAAAVDVAGGITLATDAHAPGEDAPRLFPHSRFAAS